MNCFPVERDVLAEVRAAPELLVASALVLEAGVWILGGRHVRGAALKF